MGTLGSIVLLWLAGAALAALLFTATMMILTITERYPWWVKAQVIGIFALAYCTIEASYYDFARDTHSMEVALMFAGTLLGTLATSAMVTIRVTNETPAEERPPMMGIWIGIFAVLTAFIGWHTGNRFEWSGDSAVLFFPCLAAALSAALANLGASAFADSGEALAVRSTKR